MFALDLILAFLIAAVFALAELVTTRYPRTIGLFWKRSKALWIYSVIYGVIALGFSAAYVPLASSGALHFGGPESASTDAAANPPASAAEGKSASDDVRKSTRSKPQQPSLTVLVAIMIGLSAKSLLHIRLFSVSSTGTQQSFPVGTETIVQIFEPWLLRTVLIDEFNAVTAFISVKAGRYPVLAEAQKKIVDSLPVANGFPQAERTALIVDVSNAATVRSAMEFYLRAFGPTTLDKLFP